MRRPEDILDELLVLRCQGGEFAALDVLARRWHPRFEKLAMRLTGRSEVAADVAQEAWLAIVNGVRRLDDPARFKSWSYRIVANKCADWIRREQRRRRTTEEVAREPAPPIESDPEPPWGETGPLRIALRALPPERRALLSMFYLDGLSVAAIARSLGIPAGTVKSRLFHARHHLRRTLEETS